MELYKQSHTDFNKFLNQCKKIINKIYGYSVKVNCDFWTINNNWDDLKNTGKLSFVEHYENNEKIIIDFDFTNHVYGFKNYK